MYRTFGTLDVSSLPISIHVRCQRCIPPPKLNHQLTRDRFCEAPKRPTPFPMISNIRKDRRSVFKEVGLAPEEAGTMHHPAGTHAGADDKGEPGQAQRPTAPNTVEESTAATHTHAEEHQWREQTGDIQEKTEELPAEPSSRRQDYHEIARSNGVSVQPAGIKTPWYAKLAAGRRPRARTVGSPSPSPLRGLSTASMVALVLAVLIPFTSRGRQDTIGVADAGPIMLSRADSPTYVCARWAMQCE
jgi:hypothetical protein